MRARSVTPLPLTERRKRLESLFAQTARRLLPVVTGVIRAVRFAGALEGIEGIESGLSIRYLVGRLCLAILIN